MHQILRPNTDPHDYEPRPDDVEALASADADRASSGGDLDAWVDGAADDAGSDADVVDVGAGLRHRAATSSGEPDPHWWHDPRNARARRASASATALAQVAPGRSAPRSRARSARYLRALRRARRAASRAASRSVPRAQRKLVTDHDAFGYFAARYGIDVVGAAIPARTTVAQPSAGELAELVDDDRARARARPCSPRARSTRRWPRRSRARPVRPRATSCTATRSGRAGSSGDTYLKMEARERRRDGAGASPAGGADAG